MRKWAAIRHLTWWMFLASALVLSGALPSGAGSPPGEGVGGVVAGRNFLGFGSVDVGAETEGIIEAYDAKGGGVVWTDVFGDPGVEERVNAVAVKGRTAVAVGRARDFVGSTETWILRAVDTKTGALLWQDEIPDPGRLFDVAIRGRRVFVSGSRFNGADDDWYVAAHDLRTGERLWFDQQNPNGGDSDASSHLAVKGSLLVATGSLRDGINTDWYVRAYRAKTGELLWEERLDPEGTTDFSGPVVIKGRRVFVAGSLWIDGNLDFVVRAYDARSGDELWDDVFDVTGGGDGASSIAVKGRIVFAAGQVSDGTDRNAFVRAYDVKSGDILWSDMHDRAGGIDGVSDLAVKGKRLFMSGFEANGSDVDAYLRVYDTKTGALASEGVLDQGGSEFGNGIAVRGKTVFQALGAGEQYQTRIVVP